MARSLPGILLIAALFFSFIVSLLPATPVHAMRNPPTVTPSARKPRIVTRTTSTIVGPSGGTVRFPDGGELDIPSGALTTNTTISFQILPSDQSAGLERLHPLGPALHLEAHQVGSNSPVASLAEPASLRLAAGVDFPARHRHIPDRLLSAQPRDPGSGLLARRHSDRRRHERDGKRLSVPGQSGFDPRGVLSSPTGRSDDQADFPADLDRRRTDLVGSDPAHQ